MRPARAGERRCHRVGERRPPRVSRLLPRAEVPDLVGAGSEVAVEPARMNPVRGTARQRALARAVSGASWLACRMPDAPIVVMAEIAGLIWFRRVRERE